MYMACSNDPMRRFTHRSHRKSERGWDAHGFWESRGDVGGFMIGGRTEWKAVCVEKCGRQSYFGNPYYIVSLYKSVVCVFVCVCRSVCVRYTVWFTRFLRASPAIPPAPYDIALNTWYSFMRELLTLLRIQWRVKSSAHEPFSCSLSGNSHKATCMALTSSFYICIIFTCMIVSDSSFVGRHVLFLMGLGSHAHVTLVTQCETDYLYTIWLHRKNPAGAISTSSRRNFFVRNEHQTQYVHIKSSWRCGSGAWFHSCGTRRK